MAKRKSTEDEAVYVITPKGIAALALMQSGIIQSISDPRFEGFWALFENEMKRHDYIVDREKDYEYSS